nr:YrdB family protein [Nocardioides albus]
MVFVDELLAMAAFGVWGWQHDPRWLLVWILPVLAAVVWGMFASPKATRGGPAVRPLVKVIVFGLASLALLDAGQPGWALALLVFSVVINGLAQVPAISRLHTDVPRPDLARTR